MSECQSIGLDQDLLMLLAIKGWVHLPGIVDPELTRALGHDLDRAAERCRSVQKRNGLAAQTNGSAHHILGAGDSHDEFLRRKYLFRIIRQYLGGNFILNTFGGFVNRPDDSAYVNRIHRDVRTFTRDFPLMLNMLVMLDDFREDNGATHVLSGSHHVKERPSDEFFHRHAERFLGRAGDIVLFDSNVWHAAGDNRSKESRRALTICYTRPFVKQQLDYPRFLESQYLNGLDDELKQVVGLYARVPTNHDEWYQPPESRFYRADQG